MAKRTLQERFKAKDVMSPVVVFDKLLELFKDDSRWTQGADARPKGGGRRMRWDDDGVGCFCLFGGVHLVTGGNYVAAEPVNQYLKKAIDEYRGRKTDTPPSNTIVNFNDSGDRKVSTVRRIIRDARRLAKADVA